MPYVDFRSTGAERWMQTFRILVGGLALTALAMGGCTADASDVEIFRRRVTREA